MTKSLLGRAGREELGSKIGPIDGNPGVGPTGRMMRLWKVGKAIRSHKYFGDCYGLGRARIIHSSMVHSHIRR